MTAKIFLELTERQFLHGMVIEPFLDNSLLKCFSVAETMFQINAVELCLQSIFFSPLLFRSFVFASFYQNRFTLSSSMLYRLYLMFVAPERYLFQINIYIYILGWKNGRRKLNCFCETKWKQWYSSILMPFIRESCSNNIYTATATASAAVTVITHCYCYYYCHCLLLLFSCCHCIW